MLGSPFCWKTYSPGSAQKSMILPLIHNHHALAVRHRDDAAVGNHVVILVAAAAEATL